MGIVIDFKRLQFIQHLRQCVKEGRKGLCIINSYATTYENAINILTKEIKDARRTT